MTRETEKPANMSSELSTGKTIVILAVVVGCFAVLWPKVFYPMLTSSIRSSQAPSFRDPANEHFYKQLCYLLSETQADSQSHVRLSEVNCFDAIRKQCRVKLTEASLQAFRLSKDKTNLTHCLNNFHLDPKTISLATPIAVQSRPYKASASHPHVRPERPVHLNPEMMHPALREKGRTIPHRTIERQARPGPMPGIRPPMGGGGHMSTQQTKGSGAMGILMPIYTVGIIIFFIYTIMKVLFKKDCDEDKTPKLKDFHLDPEYRKYVFAEEYLDNSSTSHRDHLRRHERETSKYKRRQEPSFTDTKIEDEQMDELRHRLEETESAMERLMSQMGSVTDKLTAAKITEVLTQAHTQARVVKDENIDDDASEVGAVTVSEDFSLPLYLQRRLEELNIQDIYMKGTFVGLDDADSFRIDPTLLTSKEIADLEDCINKLKNLSENLDNDEQIDCNIAEVPKMENIGGQIEKIGVQRQWKGDLDQYSFEGPSDIAQRDSASGLSDDDNLSGTSETGADISELKTYADEGAITPEAESPHLVIEDLVPEATYVSPNDEEHSPKEKEDSYCRPKCSPFAVEQGTQTQSAKKMSVMDLQTTYMLKEEALQYANIQTNNVSTIKEIILDATLPLETQLLIKDSHFGRITSDCLTESENGLSPYVVTSQVNLAFVGLEQAESSGISKYIVPEKRESPLPPNNVSCLSQSLPNVMHNIENPSPLLANSIEECEIDVSSATNSVNNFDTSNSTQRKISERTDESHITLNNFENTAIEATASKIVKEATEDGLQLISKVIKSDKLSAELLGCINIPEGNKKSDAEKLSSSKASSLGVDENEISPKGRRSK